MRLPAPLLRRRTNVHKNNFGHVLVVAGSPRMLGAPCLTSLAAMRSGAGLVTAAIPAGLNLTLQEKLSHVVMTFPVLQKKAMTFSSAAANQILNDISKFSAVALGPGLSLEPSIVKFVMRLIVECPLPMVVDADALNALAGCPGILLKAKGPRILTPHPGEMARLLGVSRPPAASERVLSAVQFSRKFKCVLVLKGHRTVVARPDGAAYVNTTGNQGMATAGSGDVLTGMIAAFLAHGVEPFDAAKWGALIHGAAGDAAARRKTMIAMIATDILDEMPRVLKSHGCASGRV